MLTLPDIHRPGPRAVKDRWRVLAFVVLLPAWLVAATVFATIAVSGFCAKAQATGLTAGWTKVVSAGFTDPNNSYAPAVTEFKGYLYLSTTANESGYVFSKSHKAGVISGAPRMGSSGSKSASLVSATPITRRSTS